PASRTGRRPVDSMPSITGWTCLTLVSTAVGVPQMPRTTCANRSAVSWSRMTRGLRADHPAQAVDRVELARADRAEGHAVGVDAVGEAEVQGGQRGRDEQRRRPAYGHADRSCLGAAEVGGMILKPGDGPDRAAYLGRTKTTAVG